MGDALTNPAPALRPADRRDPAVRRVLAQWRALTGGRSVRDPDRRTLVACSGGVDSSALAIVLAAARPRPVLAHIMHDLRPPEQALADRDAARDLAALLGAEFVEAAVRVRAGRGNAEARARAARYAALDRLAAECGTPYIATAHHGQDQLETVLMRLLRGAGPRGLAGIHRTRPLGHAVLVRPMLGIVREDAVRICRHAGWAWREDATNADTDRTRAALRASVLPVLEGLAPGAAARVSRSTELLRDAAGLVERRAEEVERAGRLEPGAWRWRRADLAAEPAAVIGQVLRVACPAGERRASARVGQAVRAVREGSDRVASFDLGGRRVRVTGASVEISTEGDDG